MRSLSFLLISLTLIRSPVLAAPHELFVRNASTSAVIFTSTISPSANNTKDTRSVNGTPSAPSFRTLLYLPPPTVALPSLTGRTQTFPEPRVLHQCHSPTAVFQMSHCLHDPGQAGGMQRYVVYCRERPIPPWDHPHETRPVGEAGMCSLDEICVNSWHGEVEYGVRLARCIPKEAFETLDSIDDDSDANGSGKGRGRDKGSEGMDWDDEYAGDDTGHVGGEKRRKLVNGYVLGGKQASVVVSKADGVTPLGVGSMEVDASVNGDSRTVEKTCQNCFELRTKSLAPDTDRLNMEVTLMTAGTGVAAGVMWVALLSG